MARAKRKPASLMSLDWLYDAKTRGIIFQIRCLSASAALFIEIVLNTAANLKAQNIATGFGFLGKPAGSKFPRR